MITPLAKLGVIKLYFKQIHCNIEGCKGKHKAKGYCASHYRNFRLTGDPLPKEKIVEYGALNARCVIEGCNHPMFVVSHGLCKTHYHRMMRKGTLEISRAAPNVHGMCSVAGCTRSHKAKGLCGVHYQYLKKYGTATPDMKKIGGQFRDAKALKSIPKASGYNHKWCQRHQKYRAEHRIIMEGILGRELLPIENVHHINGIKNDNRPENLELWSKSQPCGQRVKDKIAWAKELLRIYEPDALKEKD